MSHEPIPEYLLAWARTGGPAKVFQAARVRLERRRLGPRAVIDIELSVDERRDVGRMLPAGWAASAEAVSVKTLRAELQRHGCTLEDLVVAASGPLRDLPAERASREAAIAIELRTALQLLGEQLGGVPADAEAIVEQALRRWVIRRSPAIERARAVAAIIAALPTQTDPLLLSVFAAQVARDAHALDNSRPLGRAVARFLAIRAVVRQVGAGEASRALLGFSDPVKSADGWRAAWAEGGIACDAVSSQVLVLNLPLVGDAAAVRLAQAAQGEPLWLTLRSLSGTIGLANAGEVFVCENPSVVEAAADRLGSCSAPLVCTFGRPGLAALRLLDLISPAASLRVRADGDRTGWSIVDGLIQRFPAAQRWRMPEGFTCYEEEVLQQLVDDLGP